jgi:CP family cyanate transporter-like MFS transporter
MAFDADGEAAAAPSRSLTLGALGASWLSGVNCRAPLVATGALLPLVMPALHLSSVAASLLTALPLLVLAALSLPGGLLADRMGPRAALVITQLIIAGGGALRAIAPGPFSFFAAIAILGSGIGLAQPALVHAARRISGRRATVATAVYSNGLVLGGLLGSALSAPLLLPLAHGSWRGAFLLWGILGVVAGLVWLFIPLNPSDPHRRPQAPPAGTGSPSIPGLGLLILVFCCQSAIFYGLVTWLPDFYVSVGWTLAAAAVPVSVLSAGSVVGVIVTPALVRRGGGFRGALIWTGVLDVMALGTLLLDPGLGYLSAAIVGAGTAIALTVGMAAPAVLAEARATGRVSGILLAIGYSVAVLGPVGIGALRQLTGGFVAGFALLAALSVVWTLASFGLPRWAATGI